jgi:hypothetical protein
MATGALYLITGESCLVVPAITTRLTCAGVEAWYAALVTNTPRPTFSWTIDQTVRGLTRADIWWHTL